MAAAAAKICMLGDFAVGKTSLVRRYVDQQFSDGYLTTVGVKIDTKEIDLPNGEAIKIVLWDIAGADSVDSLRASYLRGMAGYLLVCDATRIPTVQAAADLRQWVNESMGELPMRLLINKQDLGDQVEVDDQHLRTAGLADAPQLLTSALTGANVELAFEELAYAVRRRL